MGKLDTGNWQLNLLGNMPSQSELTGTSAGELWAFLPLESPPALTRLEKNTGVEEERSATSRFSRSLIAVWPP